MADSGFQLGLTGWPLAHSLSPRIHKAALNALGQAGQYCLYPVEPGPRAAHGLAVLVERLRKGELEGLNVTIPHKLEVLSLVDELAPAAAAIGAANTLYLKDGRVVGENTDAAGFLAALRGEFPGLFAKMGTQTGLVLGTGGAARAAAYALLQLGWQVIIAGRSLEAAQSLASQLNPQGAHSMKTLPLVPESLLEYTQSGQIGLVVNATPAGMHPQEGTSAWPWGVDLPEGSAIYDMVYNPPVTSLVRAARSAGLPACTGLSMLVEQAGRSFELWTHLTFPTAAVWKELHQETPAS